jgi:hypothetical protein
MLAVFVSDANVVSELPVSVGDDEAFHRSTLRFSRRMRVPCGHSRMSLQPRIATE